MVLTIILFVTSIILLPSKCFAKEGQIDLEEIIKRKESEKQTLEKITSTLHEVSGRFDPTTRNEDDEIVKNDDTSDEINIDYFVDILSDNNLYVKLIDFAKNIVNYIENDKDNFKENNDNFFLYFTILIMSSFSLALVINSLATVTGKEASRFNMIMKDTVPNFEELDSKNSLLVENQVNNLAHLQVGESQKDINSESFNTKEKECDRLQLLGQNTLANLASFSDDFEFKTIYRHFHKNRVVSGRALEDAIAEADEVFKSCTSPGSSNEQNLLPYLVISQNSNKCGGNEIYNVNSELSCIDIAFMEALSANNPKFNNEVWADKLKIRG